MSDDKTTQKIRLEIYFVEYRCPNCRHSVTFEFEKGHSAPAKLDKSCPRCGCRPLKKKK